MSESDHTSGSVDAERIKAVLCHAPAPVLPPICRSRKASGVQPQRWPLASYLELGAFPSAVSCARLHAKHVMWEWGLHGRAEYIELLVSELTTNAVRAVADFSQPTFIRLGLSSDRTRVFIGVWDINPQSPTPRAVTDDGVPAFDEEGGRGLFLLTTLSQNWGWYPKWGGKVVWCELMA